MFRWPFTLSESHVERWVEFRDRPSRIRRLAIFGVVLLGVGVGYGLLTRDDGDRAPFNAQIDRIVESAMDDGPIAGVSVVITRGFRILHAEGYGYADIENRIEATSETVYKVGSITKQFTAAAVMQQVEEGNIDLDEPARTYLDGYFPDEPVFPEYTVRQLLHHTAGVRDYTILEGAWEVVGLEMTPREVVTYFQDEPLDFQPGSRFSYSNSGYVLLGTALENVTGRPYGGLLNAEIFVPQQLESTAYCDDRRLIPNRAAGYELVDGDFQHARFASMSQIYSAGAICSSAVDLARWSRALSRGDIISDDGYEEMITRGTLNDGGTIEYGFGLAVSYLDGHHRVGHVGGFLGFMSQIAHYQEEDVTIVVLTNTEGSAAANIEREIAQMVLGLDERTVLDVRLEADELAKYVGFYDIGPTVVEVVVGDGRLVARVDIPRLRGEYTLQYQGDQTFITDAGSQVVVTFDTDENGDPDGFSLRNRGIVMAGVRVAGPG